AEDGPPRHRTLGVLQQRLQDRPALFEVRLRGRPQAPVVGAVRGPLDHPTRGRGGGARIGPPPAAPALRVPPAPDVHLGLCEKGSDPLKFQGVRPLFAQALTPLAKRKWTRFIVSAHLIWRDYWRAS